MGTAERVLLLGGTGRLGRFVAALRGVVSANRSEIDLADPAADFDRHLDVAAVLNCAAFAAVDACEDRPDEAQAVNAAGPARLAQACAARGVPLLHVSTDYVFGGRQGPYAEDDERCPVQTYGLSKAAGELGVLQAGGTIARVSWLFGPGIAGFPDFVRAQLDGDGPVQVWAGQASRPTWAPGLAAWLLAVARRLRTGDVPRILHAGGGPTASREQWARELLAALGRADCPLVATPAPRLRAARPADSRLDLQSTAAWAEGVGIEPIADWRSKLG